MLPSGTRAARRRCCSLKRDKLRYRMKLYAAAARGRSHHASTSSHDPAVNETRPAPDDRSRWRPRRSRAHRALHHQHRAAAAAPQDGGDPGVRERHHRVHARAGGDRRGHRPLRRRQPPARWWTSAPRTPIIKGTDHSLQERACSGSTRPPSAQEYRVTIATSVVFKDLVKNRELWSDPNLVKTSNYYVINTSGDTARTGARWAQGGRSPSSPTKSSPARSKAGSGTARPRAASARAVMPAARTSSSSGWVATTSHRRSTSTARTRASRPRCWRNTGRPGRAPCPRPRLARVFGAAETSVDELLAALPRRLAVRAARAPGSCSTSRTMAGARSGSPPCARGSRARPPAPAWCWSNPPPRPNARRLAPLRAACSAHCPCPAATAQYAARVGKRGAARETDHRQEAG